MEKSVKKVSEFRLVKSRQSILHLARMPENFRSTFEAKDPNTKYDLKNGISFKKDPETNELVMRDEERREPTNSDDSNKFVMKDEEQKKPTKSDDSKVQTYNGKEVKQTQKFMICYRKNNEIMFCKLSSIFSFHKNQTLKSSSEDIKAKRGRPSNNTLDKEKKKDKKGKKDQKDDDDDDDKFDDDKYEDASDADSDASLEERKKKRRKKILLNTDPGPKPITSNQDAQNHAKPEKDGSPANSAKDNDDSCSDFEE